MLEHLIVRTLLKLLYKTSICFSFYILYFKSVTKRGIKIYFLPGKLTCNLTTWIEMAADDCLWTIILYNEYIHFCFSLSPVCSSSKKENNLPKNLCYLLQKWHALCIAMLPMDDWFYITNTSISVSVCHQGVLPPRKRTTICQRTCVICCENDLLCVSRWNCTSTQNHTNKT
jgi:hypothetical protein